MRISLKTLFVASALVAGIAVAPALYAHDSQGSQGSTMGPGMMGQGNMMGGGNMMGMMNMMGQMSTMMETCNKMMQGMMQHDKGEPQQSPQEPENEG